MPYHARTDDLSALTVTLRRPPDSGTGMAHGNDVSGPMRSLGMISFGSPPITAGCRVVRHYLSSASARRPDLSHIGHAGSERTAGPHLPAGRGWGALPACVMLSAVGESTPLRATLSEMTPVRLRHLKQGPPHCFGTGIRARAAPRVPTATQSRRYRRRFRGGC
jgi:hypothetical protein